MAIYEVTIPQTGEGLQEARLLRFLKQPGDRIARDEPIFEMETDKATVEIEAPVAGVLVEWVAEPDTVLPVGSVVGRIASEDAEKAVAAPAPPLSAPTIMGPTAGVPPALRNALLPPRTRSYARELGVDDAELMQLAEKLGRRVMPADLDAYMAERPPRSPAKEEASADLEPLPASQRMLVYRMQQRAAEVIAATEEAQVVWAPIDRVRRELKKRARVTGGPVPTPFLVFAWCVVRAVEQVPVFRCSYAGDGMLRRHAHLNLGLAVTRNDDELLTAAVEKADTLSFAGFLERAAEAIKRARSGVDQASSVLQMSLSNLSGLDVVRAIPVVVPPAVATLFVGSVHPVPVLEPDGAVRFERMANVTLTFDHRVINGVGAARFLSELRRQVERLDAALLLGPGGAVP